MSEEKAPPKETVKLSPSIAKVLLEHTPKHAWQAHRLLGGGSGKSTEATMDGRILESIILGLDTLEVVPYDSWRSDKSKEARAAAQAAGKLAVLQTDFQEYADAGMMMKANLEAVGVEFVGGKAQQEIIWTDRNQLAGPVECKAVLDYLILPGAGYIIIDLKCVNDASPKALTIAVTNYGWDTQAAAYIEAVEATHPELAGRGRYILAAVEKDKPFCANPREFSGAFLAMGRMKWEKAKSIWAPCLALNHWPGYQAGTIEPLPWQITQAEAL